MVYGETGCMPLKVEIQERATSFWLKLQNGSSNNLANKLVNILIKLHKNGSYYSPFVTQITNIFNHLGLSSLLYIQNDVKNATSLIKQRCRDQYTQEWAEQKSRSSKAAFYKMFKEEFKFEDYLDVLSFKKRIPFSSV